MQRHALVQRLFRGVRGIEAWLLSWAVIAMAVLTILNVASRTLLNIPLASAEELTEFLIIFICFIGLSYAAGQGRHIRMTAITDQLAPKWRKVLAIAVAASTGLLMFLLAWYSIRYIRVVRDLGTVSPVLRVPFWIVYLAVPLGLTLTGVQYALAVVRNLCEEDVYLSYEKKDEYDEPASGRI
jgi:C4-dicarboxylate transporter, DctQ subunit